MKLSNFEKFIGDVILNRGKEYFESGNVEEIDAVDENCFEIEVVGSDYYEVDIQVDEEGTIIESSCDCPFDWSSICKHQVAAFFALRDFMHNRPKQIQKEKRDLRSIFSNLSKEKLVDIIVTISKEHKEIKKELLFKYGGKEDEVLSSNQLIQGYIQRFTAKGFVDWKNVRNALTGVDITLEKAHEKINEDETESAVSLALVVLANVMDMLEFCDDSSGDVGAAIEDSLDIINEAILNGIDSLDMQQQKKLFTMIINESMNDCYDGWTDWRMRLLRISIHFAHNMEIKTELENLVKELIDNVDANDYWISNYEIQNLKLIQLEIYERFDQPERKWKFLNENIQYNKFRKILIEHYLELKDYEKVLDLCIEGEKVDNKYAGLVHNWKTYCLEAYEGLGNIEKQKELALEFVLKRGFEYYGKLKKLVNPKDWKDQLAEILKALEKETYLDDTYIKILIEERLHDKLLTHCQKNVSRINSLYPYLIDDYAEEVNQLFITYIKAESAKASNRKQYQQVCSLIREYKNACIVDVQPLVINLKNTYNRRPAFVDELGKIK